MVYCDNICHVITINLLLSLLTPLLARVNQSAVGKLLHCTNRKVPMKIVGDETW